MLTADLLLGAVLIFLLRIVNAAIGTLYIIVTLRHQRILSAVLSFIIALLWAVLAAQVINDLSNIPYLLAYTAGFAVGGYVGMWLEHRLISSYVTCTVVTHDSGHELAVALREWGYGVTETRGEGLEGKVTMLYSVLKRQDLPALLDIAQEICPDAFVTVDELRAVQRGWIHTLHR